MVVAEREGEGVAADIEGIIELQEDYEILLDGQVLLLKQIFSTMWLFMEIVGGTARRWGGGRRD